LLLDIEGFSVGAGQQQHAKTVIAFGRGCANHEIVNPTIFEGGAPAGIPTLWLHGSHDQYYRIGHCRGNFEKFLSAGGQGKFVAAAAGHALLFKPALWKNHLDHYIDSVAKGISPQSF
jgi:hypothetical protein